MRKYEFRYWDEENKEMFKVVMLSWLPDGKIIISRDSGTLYTATDSEFLMEGIGITDKHRKEMFEGDIVKTFDGEVGEIRYDRSFGSYGLQNRKHFRGFENVFIAYDNVGVVGDLFEIIGNKYDQ